ncbi:hypothetical protein ACFZBP_05160 [Streptomyces sp. NPDC008086]|uniref:hypothetical protein n=1 Tax=Streptomyces sp. NPDC008086 TaxID=3364807 RepID=UPI0036E3FC48
MVSVSHAARNIEITAESLQEDLTRLQIQKQALERELAAVVAHLGSVQRALTALETLMSTPTAADTTGDTGSVAPKQRRVAAPAEPQVTMAAAEPALVTKKSARTGKPASDMNAKRAAAGTDTGDEKKYGKLTEQIMGYFAEVGDTDVRARDVAAALGRDTDSGSINAVRSTLDRLVSASRVRRTGRGLYRAQHS